MFQSTEGKEKVVKFALDTELQYLEDPTSSSTKYGRPILTYTVALPTFISAYSADRIDFFDALNKVGNGNCVPFADGIMTFDYNSVLNVTMSKNQPRGMYVGALKMSEKCMGPNTLIFTSTGPRHSADRELFKKYIPAFDPSYEVQLDVTNETDDHRRILVKSLFKSMFESALTDEQTDHIVEYFKQGPNCIVGVMIGNVPLIREITRYAILESPVGNRIRDALINEPLELFDQTILQLADGFLFAGLLGVENLVSGLFNRIHTPGHYDLWNANSTAYILEHARLSPPVTSVTSLLTEDVDIPVGDKGKITHLKKGTTNQLGLSTANRDPSVWGGRFHSVKRTMEFDPTRENLGMVMSWNGPYHAVSKGEAPRGCPASHLSQKLAKEFVKREFEKYHRHHPDKNTKQAQQVVDPKVDSKVESKIDPTPLSRLSKLGYFIWIISCSYWMVHLWFHGMGTFTALYKYYLMFQMVVGFGAIYSDQLYYQSVLLAGTIYMLLYINYKNDCNIIHVMIQSLMIGFVWALYAGTCLWLYITLDHAPLNLMCMFYYSIASINVLYIVYDAYDPQQFATIAGRFGGICGVVSLSLNYIPSVGIFLSRLVDTVLYVPNVIMLIKYLDKTDRHGKKKHRLNSIVSNFILVAFLLAGVILAVKVNEYTSVTLCKDKLNYLCEHSNYEKMDVYAKVMHNTLKNSVHVDNKNNPFVIRLPQWERSLEKKEIFKGIYIPIEDEDLEVSDVDRFIRDFFLNKIVREPHMFPLEDKKLEWDDLPEARETLRLASLTKSIEPNVEWDPKKYTLDETISQIAFAGIGAIATQPVCHFSSDLDCFVIENLKKILSNDTNTKLRLSSLRDTAYVSDFSWLSQFEVRPDYERYGAIAFFDQYQTLIGIMVQNGSLVLTFDPEWEHAKWVWKCSMIVGITVKVHLVEIHLLYSNSITTIDREYLPKNHPLRGPFKQFNYRTAYINLGASLTLMTENGQLHRTTAFTANGLYEVFKFAFTHVRYAAFPRRFNGQMIRELGDSYPFGVDGLEFYNVTHKFVSDYVKVYYKDDEALLNDKDVTAARNNLNKLENSKVPALKSINDIVGMLTDYIIYVTAIHGIVGHVNEYLVDPTFVGSRIRIGSNQADVATSVYDNLLAGMTTNNEPRLMNDFSHLLLRDEHYDVTKAIFNKFQSDLLDLEQRINEKNKNRKWAFNGFNPRYMASSVSS
jgi:hypothetical protein